MLEAWNRHDVEEILEHLHPDVVWTDPTLEAPAHGKEAVRATLKNTFTAFPDFHVPTEDFEVYMDAKTQTGVSTWTFSGTMTGPLDIGVPATGKSVRIRGANQSRYRDGLISEYTQYYDSYELMQQMGTAAQGDRPRLQGPGAGRRHGRQGDEGPAAALAPTAA